MCKMRQNNNLEVFLAFLSNNLEISMTFCPSIVSTSAYIYIYQVELVFNKRRFWRYSDFAYQVIILLFIIIIIIIIIKNYKFNVP